MEVPIFYELRLDSQANGQHLPGPAMAAFDIFFSLRGPLSGKLFHFVRKILAPRIRHANFFPTNRRTLFRAGAGHASISTPCPCTAVRWLVKGLGLSVSGCSGTRADQGVGEHPYQEEK